MDIRQATLDDIDALVPLFDGYRQFYGRTSDVALARTFLSARLFHGQSVILLARNPEEQGIGFTQLYPSFCSLSAAPLLILYDLFVTPESRGQGVATALLRAATDHGRAVNAALLQLSTAVTNIAAQKLYEREGWQRDREFYFYNFTLNSPPSA